MKKQYLINSFTPLWLSLLLMTIFLAGCNIDLGSFYKAKYEKTEHLSAPIAAGGLLTIENEVGSIVVVGADVADCDITATIIAKARTKEDAEKLAGQVHIKTESADGRLSIKVEKPAKKHGRSISVNLDITVPKQISLQFEANVADISISNIKGPVEGSTDVGEITCKQVSDNINVKTNVGQITCMEISGDIDLTANVGEIKAVYAIAAPAVFNASVSANVGSIIFTAPDDFSATVHAETNIGSITTDWPLTVTGKIGKSLNGTIGKGQGNVSLKTNVGSIEIE